MQSNRENLRCHYRYDPLDRLTAHTPSKQVSTQHFYLKDRLATRIQGAEQHSIMQHEDQLLAQQKRPSGYVETQLLTTDLQRSVLNVLDASQRNSNAYTAYGHRPRENGLLSLLGFNGERPDSVTGHYLLGKGYRAYNPVLMRFNSPDSWSPFGVGWVNAYAYCVGDPVNRIELDGHWSVTGVFRSLFRNAGLRTSNRAATPAIQNGPMKNVRQLSNKVAYFDSVHEDKNQLNIEAHGTKPSTFNKTTIGQMSPKQLSAQLQKNNVNLEKYENIHLIVCHGGEDGGRSFAGRLAKLTNKPVDAYTGQVRMTRSRSPLSEIEKRNKTVEANPTLDSVFEGKHFTSDLSNMGSAIRFNP